MSCLNFLFRFVDRDMVMRFHWGLGIGHLYSHQRGADSLASHPGEGINITLTDDEETVEDDGEIEEDEEVVIAMSESQGDNLEQGSNDEEISNAGESSDTDGYSSESDGGEEYIDDDDDDDILEYDEMYGNSREYELYDE